MSADPIGDALHSDAEAARAEIREAGIVCPSCGVNMADLPYEHSLEFSGGSLPASFPLSSVTVRTHFDSPPSGMTAVQFQRPAMGGAAAAGSRPASTRTRGTKRQDRSVDSTSQGPRRKGRPYDTIPSRKGKSRRKNSGQR